MGALVSPRKDLILGEQLLLCQTLKNTIAVAAESNHPPGITKRCCVQQQRLPWKKVPTDPKSCLVQISFRLEVPLNLAWAPALTAPPSQVKYQTLGRRSNAQAILTPWPLSASDCLQKYSLFCFKFSVWKISTRQCFGVLLVHKGKQELLGVFANSMFRKCSVKDLEYLECFALSFLLPQPQIHVVTHHREKTKTLGI